MRRGLTCITVAGSKRIAKIRRYSKFSACHPLVARVGISRASAYAAFRVQALPLQRGLLTFALLRDPMVSIQRLELFRLHSILLPKIHTQHRTSVCISQRPFLILVSLLSLMRRRPQFGSILIVRIVQIALALAVISCIDGLSIRAAVVRSTPVREI